jgi:excisionase family DNA binding protein
MGDAVKKQHPPQEGTILPPAPDDCAVDSQWVARYCGVATSTIRKWRERKQLCRHFTTPGGQIRFRRRDVVEWWAERQVERDQGAE